MKFNIWRMSRRTDDKGGIVVRLKGWQVLLIIVIGWSVPFMAGMFVGTDQGFDSGRDYAVRQIRLEIAQELVRGGHFRIKGMTGIEFYPRKSADALTELGYRIAGAGADTEVPAR